MKTNKWSWMLALLIATVINLMAFEVSAKSVANIVKDVGNAVSNAGVTAAAAASNVNQVAESVVSVTDAVTTNSTALVTNAVESVNTVNKAIASILMSGKAVGSELYGVGKSAIAQSVDFVKEQFPDVVKQFLTWRAYEAGFNAFMWLAFALFVYLVGRKLGKYGNAEWIKEETQGRKDCTKGTAMAIGFAWVLRIVALVPIIWGFANNVLVVLKIWVAPKIYLIDFLVELTKK